MRVRAARQYAGWVRQPPTVRRYVPSMFPFVTTPAMAKTMFGVMAAILPLSLLSGNPLIVFYAVLGLVLAGYVLSDTLKKHKAHR